MNDPSTRELRKIRQLLTAIFVCLVVIILLMLPGLFYLALIGLIVYGTLMLLLTLSHGLRASVSNAWLDLTSFWRR